MLKKIEENANKIEWQLDMRSHVLSLIKSDIGPILESILLECRIVDPDKKKLKEYTKSADSLINDEEADFLINFARRWAHCLSKSEKKRRVILELSRGSISPVGLVKKFEKKPNKISEKTIYNTLKELKEWGWIYPENEKGHRNETFYSINHNFDTIIPFSIAYIQANILN